MGKQALEGNRATMFLMDPDELTIVGLDTKDTADSHPLYDDRVKMPLREGLVLNVMRYGVTEPVVVRKNGTFVEVIDGRQRVRAARAANKRLKGEGAEEINVPCVVRKEETGQSVGVMISNNEQREDDAMLAKAKKAGRFIAMGRSEDEAAVAFGVTRQAIRNWLTLVSMDEKVQKLVEEGKLSPTAAIQFHDLPHEEQVTKVKELIEQGGGKVEEAKRHRKARARGKPNGGARGRFVSVKVLRKVADDEEFMKTLSEDARHLLQWILGGGEGHMNRIKGLSAVLK